MWLINTTTLKLEEFFGSDIPRYAILSHTWEAEEVSFQEFRLPSAKSTKGYRKIRKTCSIAKLHGYDYAWVDTCCIDKRSSAELSEAINSMFQWYQNAEVCYAYLSDLDPRGSGNLVEKLKGCRWFTRGWTLQELIAPRQIQFYDKNWQYVGHKADFAKYISSITSIDFYLLSGYRTAGDYSTATRMSWAANRQTTRIEDLAYCLLGIFDVGIPLLYGEGRRAFVRLQEEIIKRSNDLTIFAWGDGMAELETESALGNLFASSPAYFVHCGNLLCYNRRYMDLDFALTNKGVRVDKCTHFYKSVLKVNAGQQDAGSGFLIPLGFSTAPDSATHRYLDLLLCKIGPNCFLRKTVAGSRPDTCYYTSIPMNSFYIATDAPDLDMFKQSKMESAVHFPLHEDLRVQRVIPESHWDHSRQLIFAPLESVWLVLATSVKVIIDGGQSELDVILCVDFRDWKIGATEPRCLIFDGNRHSKISSWLFQRSRLGHDGNDLTWDDVAEDMPEMLEFTSTTKIRRPDLYHDIEVSLRKGPIANISEHDIFSVKLSVTSGSNMVAPSDFGHQMDDLSQSIDNLDWRTSLTARNLQ